MPAHRKPRNKCKNCGLECSYPSGIYCSSKCKSEYEYDKFIQNWLEGNTSGMRNDGSVSGYIRKYMLKKNGSKCQKCGWNEISPFTGNSPLHIHHIDGNSDNCSENNLMVLCPNCHSLTENFGSRNKNNSTRSKYHRRSISKNTPD